MRTTNVQIGQRLAWGGDTPFGLYGADRFHHLYIVGQTGTGKSTLLRVLMAQDMVAGAGCAILDPHGDLAGELAKNVPRERVDDVVLFDPSDIAFPVAFNPFYHVAPDDRSLVAANLISAFKYIWADSWGPRLEYILLNSFLALLDAPDPLRPTFLALPRLLVDRNYQSALSMHIEDPGARRFFDEELARWPERQLAEALAPVQNKIGQLIANPFVRNVLCQWKPTISLSDILSCQKILIVRLPKGALGEEPSRLMGALLVAGFLHAAMRRPPNNRDAFHLYVDEFQNFTTGAFETILSEARKFSLSLTIAHQYLDQMPLEIRTAVFGNVGSMVSFRVGARDARVLATEFGMYNPDTYQGLGRGNVVARLSQAGQVSQAFQGKTRPPGNVPGWPERVLAKSRRAHGRPRAIVEAKIRRWLDA